eukprot:bmy_02504T0
MGSIGFWGQGLVSFKIILVNEIFAKGTKNAFQYPLAVNFHKNKTEIMLIRVRCGEFWSARLLRSQRECSEDGPKLVNQEGKASHHYHFTQEDLHLVLYGVIPSPQNSARLHHTISGLLVPTDSSGSDSLPQTLDNDSLQLPEGLCLGQTKFGEVAHFGVFFSSPVTNKGVRFGPFQGKVVNTS